MLVLLRTAQAWYKGPRKLDLIQIVLAPDADEKSVLAELTKTLPAGAKPRRPAARSAMAKETALATEQALEMARAFALLLGVFVITITFLISVTQRRRQFGIMRAIGATRRQIAGLIYRQALALGLGGTILGALSGALLAQYLSQVMGTLYETELPQIQLTPAPFVWAFVFGMGVSLLGAAMPAHRAAHLSPLDAMRDVLPHEIEGFSRLLTIGGVALLLGGAAVMAASITGRIPMQHSVWSAVALLIGLVLLLPLALAPLARGVAAIAPPALRVEARLGSRHLLIHRSRTTLTVGVVFIGAAAAIGLASTVIDNIADVKDWYSKTIIADFFVRATAPSMATGTSADLPDDLGDSIRKVPGVLNFDAIRLVAAEVAGQQIILVVRGYEDPELQGFDLVAGETDDVRRRLKEGQVVVGSVFSERAGLKVGDEVSVPTEDGEKKFRIAAITNDYQAGGLTMYMDRPIAESQLGVGGVDAFVIKADHARLGDVRKSLEELTKDQGLLVQSYSDIQSEIDRMIANIKAGLWGMVVLALLVAIFGVANTLTMTVLEQTFELGLLRIIAATRAQVRKMIMAQAFILGVLALVPGMIAGLAIAYLINLSTMPVIGHPVEFNFRPTLLAGGLVAGLLVLAIAAWPPAERAARIELPASLKFR